MELLIFLCGTLVGVLAMGFIMLHVIEDNSTYSGGHAAGRVHHKRSWEE